MQKRLLATAVAATIAVIAALPLIAGEGKILVQDPYARETPPNAKAGGAFMTIVNHGAANRLVGVSSDVAKVVQIHNHTLDDAGVMRMREVEGGLPLGMHETVVLQPGGIHVMLMGLEAPLKKGEAVDITLEFEDGTSMDVSVPILSIAANGPAKDGHDMKHGHKMKHDH